MKKKKLKKNFSLINLFDSIDIYGLNFPLRYKTKSSYTSNLGIIFSIISYIILIIYSIICFIQLFYHKSFTILSENDNSIKNFINLSEIPFMFGLKNLKNLKQDFSLFPNYPYKISVWRNNYLLSNDIIYNNKKVN